MTTRTLLTSFVGIALLGGSAHAMNIVLFEDTFNDASTTIDYGVPNTSVSGVMANLAGSNYNLLGSLTGTKNGTGYGTFTEDGGIATFTNQNFASAAAFTLANFASNDDVINSGVITIEIDDVTPPANSGDWFALSLSTVDSLGGNITAIANGATVGAFITSVGTGASFVGISQVSEFTFDATADVFDVKLEITNLVVSDTAGSYSYEFFVDGVTVASGAANAPDTTGLFVVLEGRDTGGTSFGNFRVSTVIPEPTSLALLGLGSLLVTRRRRP